MTKKCFKFQLLFLAVLILPLFLSCALSVRADDTAYGEAAYTYLRYLTDHFPYRVNQKEISESQENKVAAGEWIDTLMRSFGYKGYTLEGDLSRHNGNPVKDYCYLKAGLRPEKIVIGAHYDSVMTKGTEDNGTGVSVLLELAKRFSDVTTDYSIEFCFFDGEEYLNKGGSFTYVSNEIARGQLSLIRLYMNLDSIGSGDRLYVYGGEYENGTLVRDWGYNMAKSVAKELGIDLHTIPDGIPNFPPPTRTLASDQYFFADQNVPYIYFEANAWLNEAGEIMHPVSPYFYNTSDPRVTSSETTIQGQIIHSSFDDLDVLEQLFPGRIKKHMAEVSEIISRMLKTMDINSPSVYAAFQANEPASVSSDADSGQTVTDADSGQTVTDANTGQTVTNADSGRTVTDADSGLTESEIDVSLTDTDTDTAGNENAYRPVTALEVFVTLFIFALWGLWAYIYLRYYR